MKLIFILVSILSSPSKWNFGSDIQKVRVSSFINYFYRKRNSIVDVYSGTITFCTGKKPVWPLMFKIKDLAGASTQKALIEKGMFLFSCE